MSSKKKRDPACAACSHPARERLCQDPDGKASPGCPSAGKAELLSEANQEYQDEEVLRFAQAASRQEAACYANRQQRPYVIQPSKTRLQEIIEFAHRMGYRKVGLAFCLGLPNEAAAVAEIMQNHGLEVVSAICKAGRTPKEFIGLGDEDKIYQGSDEAMCNPIYQAKLLAAAGSQFNVLLGLCVGHDSMFFKYSQAPTTVLAVKDRVTGHNPLAAVYTSETYYRKLGSLPVEGEETS